MSSFGRKRDSRNHMLRNLATSLILYEAITTTSAKAATLQPMVERIIGLGQASDKLTARRTLENLLNDQGAITKVLVELKNRYEGQSHGFTRRIKLMPRLGDGAAQTRLQLTRLAVKAAKTEKVVA